MTPDKDGWMTDKEMSDMGEQFGKDANAELQQYVWNKEEIHTKKNFAADLYNGQIGVGVFLHKWEDVQYKNNSNLTHKEQFAKPIIILPDGKLINASDKQEKQDYGIKFFNLPDDNEYNLRWSLISIKNYLEGYAEAVNPEELFDKIVKLYNTHIHFTKEGWAETHALWDIGTYFMQGFSHYPLFELWGIKGTGKSKRMELSRLITFNATPVLNNPTEAYLFRETDELLPTKYFDEAEKLYTFYNGKLEGDLRTELINSSFTKGARVPRMEKLGNRYKRVYYNTFSPTMLASIKGLYGATEDRAIKEVCIKAGESDKGNLWPTDSTVFQDIRDKLYICMLNKWELVKQEYEAIVKIEGLKDREKDIWKPLLAICRVFKPSFEKELLDFAIRHTEVRETTNVDENSWEYIAAKTLLELLENNSRVSLKAIFENWAGSKEGLTEKAIGTMLRKNGFNDYFKRLNSGTVIEIGFDEAEAIASANISLNLRSLRSQRSRDRREDDDMGVNVSEANAENVNVKGERSEGNERGERGRSKECKTSGIRNFVSKDDVLAMFSDDEAKTLEQIYLENGKDDRLWDVFKNVDKWCEEGLLMNVGGGKYLRVLN